MCKWMLIEKADKIAGKEILGVRFFDGVMKIEPFISFWSPTLGKFYCNPNYYIELPGFEDD